MKTRILSFIFLVAINATLFAQHNCNVEVTSLKADKGYVFFGLYDKEKGFLDSKSQIATAKVKATGQKVDYTFKNLPDGDYAIAVYQDVNSNGKCDKNIIGYPTEGFGFSQNYRPKLSAPNFDEVKMTINRSSKISIALIGN